MKKVEKRGVGIVEEDKQPVIYKAYEVEVLKDEHGLGENLDVSVEEDVLRMKQIICQKFNTVKDENIFSKEEFEKIKK
eukprot:snap_masked-scaffold_4-processed-gene-6.30-mRNA-1 protein AED:1.00 eAED:1.00 QI:0/-1/0/0/-1/1/1/0/77